MCSDRSDAERYVLGCMINNPELQGDAHRIFVRDSVASHIHNVICANSGRASRGIIACMLAEYSDSEWGVSVRDRGAVLDAVDGCVEYAKNTHGVDYQDTVNYLSF